MNPVGESCGDKIMGDVEMVENGLNGSVLGNKSTEHNANTVANQSSKSNVILPLILFIVDSYSYFVFLYHREVNQKGLQRNTYKCHSRQEVCSSNLHSPSFFQLAC